MSDENNKNQTRGLKPLAPIEDHHDEQLEKLRRTCYIDPDCTAVDGAKAGKDLPLPVNKILALEILEGPRKGVKLNFTKGNVIIGRSPDADLHIDDDKLSRKHIIIEAFSRDQIYLSDLASTNGTFLNGMKVRSIKMKDGDEIKLGSSVLRFICKDA